MEISKEETQAVFKLVASMTYETDGTMLLEYKDDSRKGKGPKCYGLINKDCNRKQPLRVC